MKQTRRMGRKTINDFKKAFIRREKAAKETQKQMSADEEKIALIQEQFKAEKLLAIAKPMMERDLYIKAKAEVTKEEREKLLEQVRGEMLIMATLALRDEFGFGKKRLEQFARRFIDIADTIEDEKYCADIDIVALKDLLTSETCFDIEQYVNNKDNEIKNLKALGKYASAPVYQKVV